MTQRINHIFIDMDGVLTDWVSGVAMMYKRDPVQFLREWPAGEEEMFNVLGVSADSMKERIDEYGAAFWRYLPAYSWTTELWGWATTIAPTTVLTNPGPFVGAVEGKMRWLSDKLDLKDTDVMFGKPKELLAAPDRLLIEDRDKITKKFSEAGGQVYLLPQPWNSRSRDWGRGEAWTLTLEFLRKLRDDNAR